MEPLRFTGPADVSRHDEVALFVMAEVRKTVRSTGLIDLMHRCRAALTDHLSLHHPVLTERNTNTPLLRITPAGVEVAVGRERVQREDIAQEFKTVFQEKIGTNASLCLGGFDPK
ncbi:MULTISPECIES: hypothetical protein [Pseudomonas]|uniref:hypothetical protein n=1 Tax=Pseudomonas TaxID=286 RepID=UPI0019253E2C|nr:MULTISPECIES: hypothetical protein [Pseudomonas]QQX60899.1 hypothetical protein JHW28_10245 [Pseudomonas chlororaphis subsp. aurantiaca]UUT22103.1 hypothetical protein NRG23_31185 [Pseudomonas sp. T8]